MKRFALLILLATLPLASIAVPARSFAQQTDNHGIHAVPAPAGVAIDGRLDDWDLSGQVLMCYDLETLRDTCSAEVAMMFDADNLYVGVHWKDATPLGNSHDPRFSALRGWAGDCLQLRVRTDKLTHVTAWYFSPTQSPAIHLDFGVGMNKAFGGGSRVLMKTEGWKLEDGAEMAFVADADGKGYVQELRLPWKLVVDGKPPKAGEAIACGFELLWGEDDWPVHRYADNLADGASSREFFFTAVANWGTVWLEPAGRLKLPEPSYLKRAREADGVGPIDIAYDLPKDGRVTLAIDDATGRRIRTLIAARPRKAGGNTEHWDGLDDEGRIAVPGDYRFKVLSHDGIHVSYAMSFASPGNPSWDSPDGTGAWYGDHSPAIAAAAAGDHVALLCPIGEAGKHLIGCDLDGRKKWGLHNRLYAEGIALATDGKTLYVASFLPTGGKDSTRGRTFIWRCDLARGSLSPWHRKDAAGVDLLDLDLVADGPKDESCGLAMRGGTVAALLPAERTIRFIDGATGDTVDEVTGIPEGCTAISYAADGRLLLAAGESLLVIDPATGKNTPLATGLVAPFGLAVDAAGNVYVSQRGGRQNVAVFDAAGRKLREIGRAGGRPEHGGFRADAMRQPGRPVVDSRGRLWVPEATFNPKRTSVWKTDGTFVTDFIGSTRYSGSGAINPHDATMAFSDSTVFTIDLAAGTSRPVYSIAGSGHPDQIFRPGFDSHVRLVRHGDDTLLYSSDRTGTVYCLVGRNGEWRIASAVGVVQKQNHSEVNANWLHPFLAGRAGEAFVWTDANGDATVQPEELVFGGPRADGKPIAFRGCYWGVLPDADGTIAYIAGTNDALVKLPIVGHASSGAPRYDMAQANVVAITGAGARPAIKDVHHMLGGSDGRVYLNQNPITAIDRQGAVIGTYPSPHGSVHGSHNALSARPGYLIGPNTVLGVADFGGAIGEVFDLNGNLGEHYLLTADGMWIQALFKDTRGLCEQPAKAQRGMPMDAITAGGESFGGNFVRTPDGKTYLLIGSTDARVLEVTGIDSIRRQAGSFTYTKEHYAQVQSLVREKAAQATLAKEARVPRAKQPPVIDGLSNDWPELLADDATILEVRESPQKRFGRVAMRYDDHDLHVAWRVMGPGALRNAGQDERQLFKTGDCVDLMLGPKQSGSGEGNLRLLISKPGREPVAVAYRQRVVGTPESERVGFSSPWRTVFFDTVMRVSAVRAATGGIAGGYFVEATIPWSELGIKPESGLELRGDVGILFADGAGTSTVSRQYWSNRSTGLVNDVPGEAELTPGLWGTLKLE